MYLICICFYKQTNNMMRRRKVEYCGYKWPEKWSLSWKWQLGFLRAYMAKASRKSDFCCWGATIWGPSKHMVNHGIKVHDWLRTICKLPKQASVGWNPQGYKKAYIKKATSGVDSLEICSGSWQKVAKIGAGVKTIIRQTREWLSLVWQVANTRSNVQRACIRHEENELYNFWAI